MFFALSPRSSWGITEEMLTPVNTEVSQKAHRGVPLNYFDVGLGYENWGRWVGIRQAAHWGVQVRVEEEPSRLQEMLSHLIWEGLHEEA